MSADNIKDNEEGNIDPCKYWEAEVPGYWWEKGCLALRKH